jgi:hypothetical protein
VKEAIALEAFMARLLVDAETRARFAAAPEREAARAGLTPADRAALATLDLEALELAAHTFAHKRARAARRPTPTGWLRRFWTWARRLPG